jgi:ferredoxin
VGAIRAAGTTVIIEDVAFPVERLAEATLELQLLLAAHGYSDAIIFGHALEGNLHFVFTQDFNAPAEVERYRRFMDAMCRMVVEKYDGSLKAEHGTGRNVAPFVELEWGAEAYALMRKVKALFDPQGLLNPGVVINDDACVHLKNLKPLPQCDPLVDKCIECGFCEPKCPSHGLTLSPRQRIVGWREIARLGREAPDSAEIGVRCELSRGALALHHPRADRAHAAASGASPLTECTENLSPDVVAIECAQGCLCAGERLRAPANVAAFSPKPSQNQDRQRETSIKSLIYLALPREVREVSKINSLPKGLGESCPTDLQEVSEGPPKPL